MKKIKLSNGGIALIDDNDFERAKKYKWFRSKNGYAQYSKHIKITKNKYTCDVIRLHRFIMNFPKGKVIDHINGNKLDNRKQNLRICSIKENIRNSKIGKANTSGIKGVYLDKRLKNKRYTVRIGYDKKCLYFGYFNTIEEAQKIRIQKSKELFGEFSNEVL